MNGKKWSRGGNNGIVLRLRTVLKKGDVMDSYEDDETRKQCEEVRKEEEKILQRKTEGDALHIEGMQDGPQRRCRKEQATSGLKTQRKW